MRKNGFTLIELLSVIVVLALIALITIPIISGVVTKSRLNALKASAYGLIDASNLYYAEHELMTTKRFDKNNEEDTLKNLKYKGQVKEGTVIINKRGKITVCITDGKNSAYKNYNESTVTLVSKKTCTVPSNTNIVYLDDEATIIALDNQELTERLLALEEENNTLKSKVSTLENNSTIKSEIYPVGSIYMSIENTNPSTLFGGTWERIKDTFLLANGDTYAANTSGGEATHTLTVDEMPAHTHSVTVTGGNHAHSYSRQSSSSHLVPQGNSYGLTANVITSTTSYSGNLTMTGTSDPAGNGVAHNNMPPYTTVYIWKRTA